MFKEKSKVRKTIERLFERRKAKVNQRRNYEMDVELGRLLNDNQEIKRIIAESDWQMKGLKGGRKL